MLPIALTGNVATNPSAADDFSRSRRFITVLLDQLPGLLINLKVTERARSEGHDAAKAATDAAKWGDGTASEGAIRPDMPEPETARTQRGSPGPDKTNHRDAEDAARRGPNPKANRYHRDTEDTEEGSLFKNPFLSVLSGLCTTNLQILVVARRFWESTALGLWRPPSRPPCFSGRCPPGSAPMALT